MKVNIQYVDESNPLYLYKRYPGQLEPQPVYIFLDTLTGKLWADYVPELGYSSNDYVRNSHVIQWKILPVLASTANRLMRDIMYEVEDALNTDDEANRLIKEFDDLIVEIDDILSDDSCCLRPDEICWEPDDDYWWDTMADYVTSSSTDEEIVKMVDESIELTKRTYPSAVINRDYVIKLFVSYRNALKEIE